MHITLLKGGDSALYQARLAALGETPYLEDSNHIEDLQGDSTDQVYLIPTEFVSSPDWADVRIRLSHANRYYLVCGESLTTETIIACTRDGAFDVLDLADNNGRWLSALHEANGSQALWWQLYGGNSVSTEEDLLGRSAAVQSLKQSASIIGPTNASVLVLGESGAGKERVAQAIHKASGKRKFTAVNCAAIPKDLIESELFGVEKGAYTGAIKAKKGLIQEADGGTLFLDEIGELDVSLQPKLLRFLETRQARRLGSNEEYSVDLRVISATNNDLELEIANTNFRADLYYRISEVILNIPPLRARTEDIPFLAQAFLQMSVERFGKNFESIEPELITQFQNYDWPGNVRELKQSVDRLVILNNGRVLRAGWWEMPKRSPEAIAAGSANPFPGYQQSNQAPPSYSPGPAAAYSPQSNFDASAYMQGAPPNRRDRYEHARQLLDQSDNDYAWVAARMGIHPTTLYRWRKKNKV